MNVAMELRSSVLKRAAYLEGTRNLYADVQGRTYRYQDVPPGTALKIFAANGQESVGAIFNKEIRDHYRASVISPERFDEVFRAVRFANAESRIDWVRAFPRHAGLVAA